MIYHTEVFWILKEQRNQQNRLSERYSLHFWKMRFTCRPENQQLIITCQDDGIGIPYKEKECIFEHSYGKHTGIGLFIAKEILSITGLSIREFGEPGKGARFEIVVPEKEYRFLSESEKN